MLLRVRMTRPFGVYLSTPPAIFGPIAQVLAAANIACAECRIAMEKPIGHDLASSREVNEQVGGAFAEDHVFRSEEHTSELQSLMRISYAVFCLKKKINHTALYTLFYRSTTILYMSRNICS